MLFCLLSLKVVFFPSLCKDISGGSQIRHPELPPSLGCILNLCIDVPVRACTLFAALIFSMVPYPLYPLSVWVNLRMGGGLRFIFFLFYSSSFSSSSASDILFSGSICDHFSVTLNFISLILRHPGEALMYLVSIYLAVAEFYRYFKY